jgi:putative ABC transport system permease protein
MFKNYFKTAWRNLSRNSNYTMINIAGLAIGIAVCVMIFIIIQFHSGFDNFHNGEDRIYRVLTEYHHSDSKDVFNGKGVPFGFPNALKTSFPEVQNVALVLADYDDQIVVLNSDNKTGKKFKENKGFFYMEPTFFKIFNFPLLAGSYETLKDPNNVLLSKETAEKYFGDWHNATGKTFKINNTDVVKVSGILATIPANTQFQIKAVVAFGTGSTKAIARSTDNDGTSGDFGCFITLKPGASASSLANQLKTYSKKVKSANNNDVEIIQPYRNIHYDVHAGDFSDQTISHKMINILWLIAAFILLIACVNFINLSTAQAVNRSKEVGVRKVLGSNNRQLQLQFIAETFLIVFSSVLLSLAITGITLPFVGNILQLPLNIGLDNALSLAAFLAITCVVVTLLAGFYPSIVLSRFNPITALKSKLAATSNKGISLRRGLVIFQFIIAQILIIGTLVIVKQMNFFTNQPLGFDKDAIVNIPVPTDSLDNTKLDYVKQQLTSINGIQRVSFSSNTPVEDNTDNWGMFSFDHNPKQVDFYSIFKFADNDYVPTYKLPLVAGRNLEPSDTMREFLVNEMMVKNLGIINPQKALNKEIKFSDKVKGNIVGVMKDFNTRSFRDGLAPMLISTLRPNYNQASIKLATKDVIPVMQSVEKIWNTTYPDFVFEYQFLGDKIAGFYKQENQLAYLYKIFAAIAIFLSCLGLYGLASFMAVQRIKEVGIRKALGASAASIVYLFSKEFVLLIAISFAIAVPVAWYFMNKWLQNFAFKIDLSWWIFIVGGIASIIIALISVSFQAIKAAIANPVKSLRTE